MRTHAEFCREVPARIDADDLTETLGALLENAARHARGARLDLAAPGDGLGLAIATEIAEAAGGGITLANTEGGLRVTLTVPAVPRKLTVR